MCKHINYVNYTHIHPHIHTHTQHLTHNTLNGIDYTVLGDRVT